MRDYGRLYTSFWSHPKIRTLDGDARLLAIYLLTSPHSNSIGCYLLSDAYAADDLTLPADPWTGERVSKAMTELSAKGFAHRFSDARHVCLVDYVDWNRAENPNVVKRMIKEFDQLLKDPLRYYPAMGILSHGDWVAKADRRRLETLCQTLSETLPKPFRKPVHSLSLSLSLPFPDHSIPLPSTGKIENSNGSAAPTSSLGLEGRDESSPPPAQDDDKKGARESSTKHLPMIERVALAASNRKRKAEVE